MNRKRSQGTHIGLALVLAVSVFGPVRAQSGRVACEHGQAAGYPCDGVDLVSHLSIAELGGAGSGVHLNDLWGWTDPQTGVEYAPKVTSSRSCADRRQ